MPTNHPEYDALYAAVCATPDDDTPRLVLADWLDEHDDPHRAAHIRGAVNFARMQENDPHTAAVVAMRRRAGHTDWFHYADVAAISPEVARMDGFQKQAVKWQTKAEVRWKHVMGKRSVGTAPGLQRGFPHTITVRDCKSYAAKQPPENLPGYSYFVVEPRINGAFDDFLACPNFARATGVYLYSATSPEVIRGFGHCPAVRNFRSLKLSFNSANPAYVVAVAMQPNWSGLTHLEFWRSDYGRDSLLDLPPEFTRATQFATLQALELGLRGITGASVVSLAQMPWPHLRTLDLHYNRVSALGAAALANGKFPELRSLDLSSNRIGNIGAAAFADSGKLPALATLDLSSNDITDPKAMAQLIAGPAFPVLTGLSLRDNRCNLLHARSLADLGRGPTLRLLSLRHCSLNEDAAVSLAAAPSLAHLVALDLAGNAIGDVGARAIAMSKWDRMTCLDLGTNGITGNGVEALVMWPGLAKLQFLNLGGNPIGLAGVKALVACPTLKKCRKLVVSTDKTDLGKGGLQLLEARFGRRLDCRS